MLKCPWSEIEHWIEYFSTEPFSWQSNTTSQATIAQAIYQSAGHKVSLEDVMPQYGQKKDEQFEYLTWAEAGRMLGAVAK